MQCHRLRRQYSERKDVVGPYPRTLRTSNNSVVLRLQKTCTFTKVMTPRTKTNSMHREDLFMTRSQVTLVLQEGNVPRSTTRNSLPAPPSVPSDHFYVHESDDCASGSASRSNPMQKTHCMDQEDMKNITLCMDSQEFSIQKQNF